jgi:hypothetical protein
MWAGEDVVEKDGDAIKLTVVRSRDCLSKEAACFSGLA